MNEPSPAESKDRIDSLARRLDELERENQRLRRELEPMLGPDNPWFHPQEFIRAIRRSSLVLMSPVWVVMALIVVGVLGGIMPRGSIAGIPWVDLGGAGTRHPGLGLGVVSFGGGAVGVVACGGMACGVVALGGGAVGLLAIGGGSVGLVSIGGSAVGAIALGGTAVGWYALGYHAYGKHVLGINRQDQAAVELFVPWIPGLRRAVTNPMPVLPLSPQLPAQPGADRAP